MAVSPQVLWGNVASAANGAAAMIVAARPDLAAAAAGAAAAVLRYPALAGTYRGNPGAAFRRRNCCLIYRLSPPGLARYCGDCVLGPGPGGVSGGDRATTGRTQAVISRLEGLFWL
jgi:hypothetical protein